MLKLLDNDIVNPQTKEELLNEVRELQKSTKFTVETNGLQPLVLTEDENGQPIYVSAHKDFATLRREAKLYPEEAIEVSMASTGFSEALIEETKLLNKAVIRTAGKICPLSRNFLSDAAVVGIHGDCCASPTYAFYSLLAQQTAVTPITLISRTGENGETKYFGMRSGRYMPVPQTELLEMTEKIFPDGKFVRASVTNFLTEAVFSFPEEKASFKDKIFTPVIRLATSDTGAQSVVWELGWKDGNEEVFLASGKGSVSRVHKGTWDAALKSSIESKLTTLRSKFKILVERLAELDKEIFYTPDEWKEAMKNLMEDNKSFKTLVKKSVRTALIENAPFGLFASKADIVLYLMGTTLDGVSSRTAHAIKEACGEFAYTPFRGVITPV